MSGQCPEGGDGETGGTIGPGVGVGRQAQEAGGTAPGAVPRALRILFSFIFTAPSQVVVISILQRFRKAKWLTHESEPGSSQGRSDSLFTASYPSASHRAAVVNTYSWVGRDEDGGKERWHRQDARV